MTETLTFLNDAQQPSAVVEVAPQEKSQPAVNRLNVNGGLVNQNLFPHVRGKQSPKPIATHENLNYLLNAYGIGLSYDVIKKDISIRIPGVSFSTDNIENSNIGFIESLCVRNDLPTTCRNYLTLLADQNQSNPILDWIDSREWDGVDRLKTLCDSIHVPPSQESIKKLYIKKWLMQCVGILFNSGHLKAELILVFCGAQGRGKTTWFNNLLPDHLSDYRTDGVILRPDDKDSVMSCVSHWLVELGELDATFSKSEIGQLKAFLSKRSDKFRRPYDRKDSNFSRRTSFFASVNDPDFLVDKTGNRRILALDILEIDWLHDFDAQQLWSQVMHELAEAGGADAMPWELQGQEKYAQEALNETFTKSDPVEEKLDWLIGKFSDGACNVYMNSTQLAEAMGYYRPSRSDLSIIGRKMTQLGYEKGTGRMRYSYLVPQLTIESVGFSQ